MSKIGWLGHHCQDQVGGRARPPAVGPTEFGQAIDLSTGCDIFALVKEMAQANGLGQFELLVLLAALSIGDQAYGVSIAERLDEATGQETAVASVYAALQRLESKGLVRTRLGNPTAERGGRAKRFVEVTAAGRRQARESRRTLERLWFQWKEV